MHTGEKPYECTRCDKTFSDKSALKRHLKAHEKRALQRTFTRGTCGETFHNRAPYNAHIRTAHQQPVAATRKRTAQKTTDAPSTKRPKRSDQASTSTASEPASTASAENGAASWQPDLFSFQPTLFQLAKKTSPKHTGNIGRRSVRVLATTIVYKTGTISACLRSVLPPSANNLTASLLTRARFSKSTFPVLLFSVTQKLPPFSTTTLLQTTIWC